MSEVRRSSPPALPADSAEVEIRTGGHRQTLDELLASLSVQGSKAADPLGLTNPSSTWEQPNLEPLWIAVRDRLRIGQAEIEAVHRGPDRVYLVGEEPAGAEGGVAAGEQWGRTVVVPLMTLWEEQFDPARPFEVGFNVMEQQAIIAGAPVPRSPLALAQGWIYRLLDGWTPGPFTKFAAGQIWQSSRPTDPLREEAIKAWFSTSTWRTTVVAL